MLDEIDLEIIRNLQENARFALSYISDQVNLSVPAVSERIKKLELKGYIRKYTTILDGEKFNKGLICFCFIRLNHMEKDIKSLLDRINEETDIIECHSITGEYEYLLKIMTKDRYSLEKLLNSLRKERSVLNLSTTISLSRSKNLDTFTP